MLYAGTTSLSSFKYSIFLKGSPLDIIDTVKKLKQRSKSASNRFLSKCLDISRTSETLRNEIVSSVENTKFISIHNPKHLKPVNDHQFGHYLAGLIDGDGHFSVKLQLVIVFNRLDASLAYYIKNRIGFGNVKKIKNKNAYLFIISNKQGLEKVIHLINGKIRTINKFNQITYILNQPRFIEYAKLIQFKLNTSTDLKNHWLAGFADADASFQVKCINREERKEIRLNFQIDQKKKDLLILIQTLFGGNIGYRSSQDTYYYGSTSFGSAKKVIQYFDCFHLLSSKHVNYLKWRKAYIIIQDKAHLTNEGIEKILKLKSTMNSKLDSLSISFEDEDYDLR